MAFCSCFWQLLLSLFRVGRVEADMQCGQNLEQKIVDEK